MADIAHHAPTASWPAQILAAVRAAHARRQRYLTTLRELETLGDRELADLGLARSDLPRIARDSAGPTP